MLNILHTTTIQNRIVLNNNFVDKYLRVPTAKNNMPYNNINQNDAVKIKGSP